MSQITKISRTQALIAKVAEEALEVAARAFKALRFGLSETERGQDQDNAQRLMSEYTDLSAAMLTLSSEPAWVEDTNAGQTTDADLTLHLEKLEKFLQYSIDIGQVEGKMSPEAAGSDALGR